MRSKSFAKRILTLLLAVLMVGSSPKAYALESTNPNDSVVEDVPGYEKVERWSYTSSTGAALTISSSGYAVASTDVIGYQGTTTKIIIYSYLQKYSGGSWSNVSSFSNTTYDWIAAIEEGFGTYAAWGHDYRVYNSIYVYAGDAYEHVNAYSKVHHYHSTSDSSNCTL